MLFNIFKKSNLYLYSYSHIVNYILSWLRLVSVHSKALKWKTYLAEHLKLILFDHFLFKTMTEFFILLLCYQFTYFYLLGSIGIKLCTPLFKYDWQQMWSHQAKPTAWVYIIYCVWMCAICTIIAPFRLYSFTVNYVHPSSWFCSVVP